MLHKHFRHRHFGGVKWRHSGINTRSGRFVLSPIKVRHLLDCHREPNVNQFRLNVTVRNQGNFCVWGM